MAEPKRVALVHDWLTGMRGGERCLESLCSLFPDAPLYTLLHIQGSVSATLESHLIRTSFVQDLPFAARSYRHYLPLFPTAIERFDLRGFDVVLSSSHCVAKGVVPAPGAVHVCYCYTPMRYVWNMYEEYFGRHRAHGLQGAVAPFLATYLRAWDVASAARVDRFIAISRCVRERIWRYYRREADVVYPPVAGERTRLSIRDDGYYLIVSSFAPYKRIDLAVDAFSRTGQRLVVVGSGQNERRLKKGATRNIEFVGAVSDQEVSEYYAGCTALVFPGEEDFGIVPVEAQCYGKPVIAYGAGGALETIRGVWADDDRHRALRGATGIFFRRQTPQSLIEALRVAERIRFQPESIRRHALTFSEERFQTGIRRALARALGAAGAKGSRG